MYGLTEFEQAVLNKLLAGDHPVLRALRGQADTALLHSHEYTGTGFICSFKIPPECERLPSQCNFHVGDVNALVEGLEYGAGFVLFVRDGYLNHFEGYSYEESWPLTIHDFRLEYQDEPRRLEFLDSICNDSSPYPGSSSL